MHFFAFAEVLVDFFKKHQKTVKFIGEFCAFRALSISIGHNFVRFDEKSMRFDADLIKFYGLYCGPEKSWKPIKTAPNGIISSLSQKKAKSGKSVIFAYFALYSPKLLQIQLK